MSINKSHVTPVLASLLFAGALAFGPTALAASGSGDNMSDHSSMSSGGASKEDGPDTGKDYTNGKNTDGGTTHGAMSSEDNSASKSMSSDDEMATGSTSTEGTQSGSDYSKGGNKSGEQGK